MFEVNKYSISEFSDSAALISILRGVNVPKLFKDWDFLKAWDETSTNKNYLFIIRNSKSQIVGYLPLAYVQKFGLINYFGPIGDGILGIAGGGVDSQIKSSVALDLILGLIEKDFKGKINIVRFGPDLLTDAKKNKNFYVLKSKSEADYPIIRNPGLIKDKITADLSQALRNMQKNLEVEFTRNFNTSDNILAFEKDLSDLMKLHSVRWKKSRFSSLKASSRLLTLLKNVHVEGKFFVSSLKINNDKVAFVLGAADEDRYYYILTAFNFAYPKLSPGKRLLQNEILFAANRNLIFDLMNHLDDYKVSLSDAILERSEIIFLKPKIFGRILAPLISIFKKFAKLNRFIEI